MAFFGNFIVQKLNWEFRKTNCEGGSVSKADIQNSWQILDLLLTTAIMFECCLLAMPNFKPYLQFNWKNAPVIQRILTRL